MEIKILPSNIANMIAAGEVVQRPASVVKELVENAVDAGAGQITVILTDAGRTLIQVTDNGCGMSSDQAVLCFERHATSKIAEAEDLNSILTFGFRGEALASIAAVAEVTLKTRRAADEVGCKVEFADSHLVSRDEVSAPVGSTFAVRNLFYNVPARRKFLKSDNVELRHVVEEFQRVALTRPEIGFTLIHNGKELFVLKPAKSLKYRIQDLLGNNVAGQVVDVEADTSVVKIKGYVGRPDQAKKTLGNQFFFVNGRYFRSPYFHKAVMNAYENMLPLGTTPSYFLYLEIDPSAVDVNIHPTKTEIKFEEDSVIFQIIYACVKESLGRNSFGASIDFDKADMPELPTFSKEFSSYRPEVIQPNVSFDPNFNPFEPQGGETAQDDPGNQGAYGNQGDSYVPIATQGQSLDSGVTEGKSYDSGRGYNIGASYGYVDKREDYGKLFEDKLVSRPQVMVAAKGYIAVQSPDGLLLINVRRARERVFYERFLSALSGGEHVVQEALFPVQVNVGVENRLIFEEHAELLHSLGFDISPFGTDTIVVNGMPEGFQIDQSSVEAAMAEVMIALSDNHTALPGMMESATAAKFAKMAANECRPLTSAIEASALSEALFACSNSEFTNNGKRIISVLKQDDMDKMFR